MKPEERFTQVLVAFLMAVAFLVVGHLATTDSPSSVRAGGTEISQTDTIPSHPALAADEKTSNGKSIADLTRAIELNPEDPNAYLNRALAYEEKGQYDLAIADCTKVIQLAPEAHDARFLAHFARGDIIYLSAKIDEYDLAIADFTKVIQLDPEWPGAYQCRACIYAKINEYDLAIADFTKVIQLVPEDHDAYLKRGCVYAMQGEYDLAMKDIRMAHSLGGTVGPGLLKALREASQAASDYFTLGSHKDDVLKVQGTPDSIFRYEILDREVWWYGLSTIDFSIRDNRVVEWDNNGELKVKLQSSKDFISKNTGRNALALPSGTVPPVDGIGMTGDNRFYAIIRGIPVNEGDTVDGFAVVKIDMDKVVFQKDGAVFTNTMH